MGEVICLFIFSILILSGIGIGKLIDIIKQEKEYDKRKTNK
jgi:hypothetical protein